MGTLCAGRQTDALLARLLRGEDGPVTDCPSYSSAIEAAFTLREVLERKGKLEAFALSLLRIVAPGREITRLLEGASHEDLAALAHASPLDRAKAALLTLGPPPGFPEVWPAGLPRD